MVQLVGVVGMLLMALVVVPTAGAQALTGTRSAAAERECRQVRNYVQDPQSTVRLVVDYIDQRGLTDTQNQMIWRRMSAADKERQLSAVVDQASDIMMNAIARFGIMQPLDRVLIENVENYLLIYSRDGGQIVTNFDLVRAPDAERREANSFLARCDIAFRF